MHRVHVAVAHAEQGLIASAGNPAHHSFVRSAIKMFQVLPFVEAGGVERFRIDRRRAGALHRVARRRAVSRGRGALDPRESRRHRSRAGLRRRTCRCTSRPPTRCVAAGEAPGAHSQQLFGQARRHARALRPAAVGDQRLSPRVASDAAARRSRRWRAGCASTPTRCRQAIDGCGLPTFALALDAVAEAARSSAAAVADGDAGAGGDLQRDGRASGVRRRHRSPRHRPDARRRARGCSRRSAPKASTAPAFRRMQTRRRPEGRGRRQARRRAGAAGRAASRSTRSAPANSTRLSRYAAPEILNTRNETVGRIAVTQICRTLNPAPESDCSP